MIVVLEQLVDRRDKRTQTQNYQKKMDDRSDVRNIDSDENRDKTCEQYERHRRIRGSMTDERTAEKSGNDDLRKVQSRYPESGGHQSQGQSHKRKSGDDGRDGWNNKRGKPDPGIHQEVVTGVHFDVFQPGNCREQDQTCKERRCQPDRLPDIESRRCIWAWGSGRDIDVGFSSDRRGRIDYSGLTFIDLHEQISSDVCMPQHLNGAVSRKRAAIESCSSPTDCPGRIRIDVLAHTAFQRGFTDEDAGISIDARIPPDDHVSSETIQVAPNVSAHLNGAPCS